MKTANLRSRFYPDFIGVLSGLALLIACPAPDPLAGWVYTPPKKQTIARTCILSNQLYLVLYDYDPKSPSSVPLTYPPGQTHYPCAVTVFKAQVVGGSFPGQVTLEGCFEDRPEDMVAQALNPGANSPSWIQPAGNPDFIGVRTQTLDAPLVLTNTFSSASSPILTNNFEAERTAALSNDLWHITRGVYLKIYGDALAKYRSNVSKIFDDATKELAKPWK